MFSPIHKDSLHFRINDNVMYFVHCTFNAAIFTYFTKCIINVEMVKQSQYYKSFSAAHILPLVHSVGSGKKFELLPTAATRHTYRAKLNS